MENISRSGVLFRAEARLEPNTPVEMLLHISSSLSLPASGSALRHGRIVRAAQSTVEPRPAVAAMFVDVQPAPAVDPRRI